MKKFNPLSYLRFSVMLLSFVLLLSALGCASKPLTDPQAKDRAFIKSGSILTDGELVYLRLPFYWGFTGDYPYQIGKVKGGNVLYASDKSGTFVQEKADSNARRPYSPWRLSSVDLPEVPVDNVDAYVNVHKQGDFKLSELAQEEFMTWYLDHLPGEADRIRPVNEDALATIYFRMISDPDLKYDLDYHVIQGDGCIYITDRDWYEIGTFGSETVLYQEIVACLAPQQ